MFCTFLICVGPGEDIFRHMTKLEEYLDIIPGIIEHSIIKTDWDDKELKRKWSEEKYPFLLRIGKTEDNRFRAFYVYTGFEGEQQILPMSDEELQQYLEYGCVFEPLDISKPTLLEALEELICWLRNTGQISNPE